MSSQSSPPGRPAHLQPVHQNQQHPLPGANQHIPGMSPTHRHHYHHHPPASPTHYYQRPVTGYTSMGSPMYGRRRSASLGTVPLGVSNAFGQQLSSYTGATRSVPASPVAAGLGNDMPSAPFLPDAGPPEIPESQKAMEAAVAAERKRAREMEEQEESMTADELRAVLKRERTRTGRIAADLAAIKSAAVQSQLEAEVIEEGRINGLMRRLDKVQEEKGRIIVELEREEEMVSEMKGFDGWGKFRNFVISYS